MAAAIMEYKWKRDDAWYEVSLQIVGCELRLHYEGFGEEHDEIMSMKEFKANIETSRIRFPSTQLQDRQCRRVKQEMLISATNTTDGGDLKFFDAVVKEVYRNEHGLVDGEEYCTCKFKVLWKAGPSANEITTVTCENICLLSPGSIKSHPVVKAFANLVRKKLRCKLKFPTKAYPERKTTARQEGNSITEHKDKWGESGMTTLGGVCDLQSGHFKRVEERVEKLSVVCRQNTTADTPSGSIESTLPSANEVDNNPLNGASASSPSREVNKKSDDHHLDVASASSTLMEANKKTDDQVKLVVDLTKAIRLEREKPYNLGITGSKRPCHGWLDEDESVDVLGNKNSGQNVVKISLTRDIGEDGSVHSVGHSKFALSGVKRPSFPLAMGSRGGENHNYRRVKQSNMENNQKDIESTKEQVGKNDSLTCSRGKGKQMQEPLAYSADFQGLADTNSDGVNTLSSSGLITAHLKHNTILSAVERPICSTDFQGPAEPNTDSANSLSSGLVTTADLKHNTMLSTTEPPCLSTDLQGLADPILGNTKKTGKIVYENKQPAEQLQSNEVAAWDFPIEVVEISSDKKYRIFKLQRNNNDIDYIDALRRSDLTTQDAKGNLRNDPSDNSIDLNSHPDKIGTKSDIVKDVTKQDQINSNKRKSPEFPPEVVNISSDEENGDVTSKKKCKYGSEDLSGKVSNYVQLQKDLFTTLKIEEHTCSCRCHQNVQSGNEDRPISKSKYDGQKNVQAIQYYCNGHSADMSSFHCECDLGKHLHLMSKEFHKLSPGSYKIYLRPSESHIRKTCLPACNQCKTCSCNNLTGHCKYSLQPLLSGCLEVQSSDIEASSKDDLNMDVERTHHSNVSNCKMKPMVSMKKADMRIQRDLREAGCGCMSGGCGHSNEDVRTKERHLYISNILILDNLEKDVSPFDVKKLLSCMGCTVNNVHILPSREFEKFTRGYVLFQDRASLMKALDHLEDERFLIVSSNGRPWVALRADDGIFEGSFEEFNIKLEDADQQCAETSSSNRILFVRKGTEEYEKARKNKNIFLKLREDLAALHIKMELMENEIIKS